MADVNIPNPFSNWKDSNFLKSGTVVFLVAVFVLILALGTMFFSIGPDQQGVVLRFGKYVRTVGPGLHTKWPFNIERSEAIRVEYIFKEEFGFRTSSQQQARSEYMERAMLEESLMLTGDLNALVVDWIVQFKVSDPVKLLFKMRDPVVTLRDVSEAVMRKLVGDYSVDEVLTTKRAEINIAAERELQEILDSYDSGIKIVTVKLQDVTVPDKVKPAFNEVNEAKQEKERVINQALQAYNQVVPRAKGESDKTLFEAEAYSIDRVNRAKGEVHRFEALLKEYQKYPDITKRRLYLENLEVVMKRAKAKYVIDPKETRMLPLLDLRAKESAS